MLECSGYVQLNPVAETLEPHAALLHAISCSLSYRRVSTAAAALRAIAGHGCTKVWPLRGLLLLCFVCTMLAKAHATLLGRVSYAYEADHGQAEAASSVCIEFG